MNNTRGRKYQIVGILWFLIYGLGGSYALAKYWSIHLLSISPFIPGIVFLWVVGYFVGFLVLEYIIQKWFDKNP